MVVNGTEAEPISGKDKLLLRHLPHLVLDGAVAAAQALGAREAIVVIDERATAERAILERAHRDPTYGAVSTARSSCGSPPHPEASSPARRQPSSTC